jgi:pimeloyl-ACP methyl ester carboxylesterase
MPTSLFDRPDFNHALFHPRTDVSRPPDGARDTYVDVPGARLHVRAYAADANAVSMLLFHGNGEVVADYDDASRQFAAAGVALVVADYRGYGASTGTPTLRGTIEDARIVAEAVQPMLVMGRSLGGAAAHELFARPIASVRGVVLESAFSDLDGLLRRRGLEPPERYTAEERAMFDPIEKLRDSILPLLIIHGSRDELVVPDEARAAYAAARSSKSVRLGWMPGHGHNDVSLCDLYWYQIRTFVDSIVDPYGERS